MGWRWRRKCNRAAIVDKIEFGIKQLRHAEDQHSVPEGHHIATAHVKVGPLKGSRQAWKGTALNQSETLGVTTVDSDKEVVNFVKGRSVRGGRAAPNVRVHGGHRLERGSYWFESDQLDVPMLVEHVRVLFEIHLVRNTHWVSGGSSKS